MALPLGIEIGAKYVITSPLGDRATLNDTTDPDHVGFVTGIGGLERAAIRESADVLAEADGGAHGRFYRDRLAFTIEGLIDLGAEASGISRQDKLLRATAAHRGDGTVVWTPSTIPTGVRVAFREQNPTRITGRRPRTFLATLVAEDPFVYGNELKTVTLTPTSTGGGFASPLSSKLNASVGLTLPTPVVNQGGGYSWPRIVINGPCGNPVISNGRSGETIYLVYTLAAGESLVLETNPRRRYIRLADQADRRAAYDFDRSAWWPLYPGSNDVRLGFTSYGAGASVDVVYRDAWG